MIQEVNDRIMNLEINPNCWDYDTGEIKRFCLQFEVRKDILPEVLDFLYERMKREKPKL